MGSAPGDHAMMCAGWIRFRMSLMAMRRTSWIDQRINGGAVGLGRYRSSALRFFGGDRLARYRMTAIMAKASITKETWRCQPCQVCSRCDRARTRFSRSQSCLRSPSDGLLDRHQRFDGCSRWTPGGEEGEIAVGDMTTDQQTSCPKTMICAVKFFLTSRSSQLR